MNTTAAQLAPRGTTVAVAFADVLMRSRQQADEDPHRKVHNIAEKQEHSLNTGHGEDGAVRQQQQPEDPVALFHRRFPEGSSIPRACPKYPEVRPIVHFLLSFFSSQSTFNLLPSASFFLGG